MPGQKCKMKINRIQQMLKCIKTQLENKRLFKEWVLVDELMNSLSKCEETKEL